MKITKQIDILNFSIHEQPDLLRGEVEKHNKKLYFYWATLDIQVIYSII